MVEDMTHVTSEMPFGDSDAARSDPKDGLIEIDGVYESPINNPLSMRERIIVGRKGSGKTLYLRAHQLAASKRDFVVLDDKEAFRTSTLIEIVHSAEPYLDRLRRLGAAVSATGEPVNLRFWTMLWERAILLAVCSLFHSKRPAIKSSEEMLEADEFKAYFGELVDIPLAPLTPTSFLSRIVRSVRGATGWSNYLEHPKWPELKSYVADLVRKSREVSFYIDSIDEEFDDAPALWAICQLGLFYAVFQTFSERELFAKIHVVIALRDIVFDSVMRTEHSSRNISNSHIRHLIWDQVTVRRFLIEKIRRLESRYLARPEIDVNEDPFGAWLGFTNVQNVKRSIVEPVSDYILRHSRMIPRDIVVMGNEIFLESARRRLQGKVFGEPSLRKAVNSASLRFGEESLLICINEALMSADYMASILQDSKQELPMSDADDPKSARALIGNMRNVVKDQLKSMVMFLDRKEQFTHSELIQAMSAAGLISTDRAGPIFGGLGDDVYRFDNIMWRHGLLAFRDDQANIARWRYNWRGASDARIIRSDANLYGFHASLVSYFDLKVNDENPVY